MEAYLYWGLMALAAYVGCCLLEHIARRNARKQIILRDYKDAPLKQPIRVNVQV